MLILYGKVQRISVPLLPSSIYFKINPNKKLDFELIKELPDSPGTPTESNYKIEYEGISKEIITVHLKLGKLKIYRLKWMQKKYLVQKEKFKIGFLLLILGLFVKLYVYNTPVTSKIDTTKENDKNVSSSPKINSKILDSTARGIIYSKDSVSKVFKK